MAARADTLVGREPELATFERTLDEVDRGRPGAIELSGEAGIGKTRLLAELAARADSRGYLVLGGAASELERDLPFAVFIDACDQYLAGLAPGRFRALDEQARADLGRVFPSLWAFAEGRPTTLQHERYRVHRAVRLLLEALAGPRPFVLLLDDLHWADAASIELIGALLRRPPAGRMLAALALRPLRLPARLPGVLERAERAGTLTRIRLGTLSAAEARQLLGGTVDASQTARLFEESGGNPFYLQQLARSLDRASVVASANGGPTSDGGVPAAVAASLQEELALLSASGRRTIDGAAVAGDPFEPELAAAAAGTSEEAVVETIDELLGADLLRTTETPRRFRFRHPLVRRAVYESTGAAWRMGAHERCAAALAVRAATPAAVAHHVERSARQGDVAAVSILREAGEATARLAPETAARWFGGALDLLASTAPPEERAELLLARAGALAGAGHFAASHEALVEALGLVPDGSIRLFTTLATACAREERFIGRYGAAHARLVEALERLPDQASEESVALLIELARNEFYRSRYETMRGWAARAVERAGTLGEPTMRASAMAMLALADASTSRAERALPSRAEAAALIDSLSDHELSAHIDATVWLAVVELYLDRFAEADAHATRALALARATGQGDPLGLYQILPRVWYVRGKLAEATELLDDAIEAGRLLGTPPALAGNLFNRSVVAVAVGDLDLALATAEEAVDVTRELDPGFVTAWAAVRLASARLETGQPARAVELILDGAGGPELPLIPGGWRASCLELLTRCWLALGRRADADRAAGLARAAADAAGLALPSALADRAAAAVALHAGEPARAQELARASAERADEVGAPIEAAISRTVAGRALAQAGEVEQAIAELQRAAAALDSCGAQRYRQIAERELGKLGRRPYRRSKPGRSNGIGVAALTERELEVARLVVDRMTNAEIAAQLFLSRKTVETHLSNIFNKVGVPTRVALARAVEASERTAAAR